MARFFEDAYRERYTASAILAPLGTTLAGAAVRTSTSHLAVSATISDAETAPGHRLTIVAQVTPRPQMHLYAPGKHDYQVVHLTIDPQPWLRAHDTVYPASEIYHFKPLDERVEVYSWPFRLLHDVTARGVCSRRAPLVVTADGGHAEVRAGDGRALALVDLERQRRVGRIGQRPPARATSGRSNELACRGSRRVGSRKSQVGSRKGTHFHFPLPTSLLLPTSDFRLPTSIPSQKYA